MNGRTLSKKKVKQSEDRARCRKSCEDVFPKVSLFKRWFSVEEKTSSFTSINCNHKCGCGYLDQDLFALSTHAVLRFLEEDVPSTIETDLLVCALARCSFHPTWVWQISPSNTYPNSATEEAFGKESGVGLSESRYDVSNMKLSRVKRHRCVSERNPEITVLKTKIGENSSKPPKRTKTMCKIHISGFFWRIRLFAHV